MSLFTLALAGEFKDRGVAVNSLWPRTAIATAAVQNEIGGAGMLAACRKPEIVADAAHFILTRPARECSGNFFLDDEVLLAAGVRDFAQYDMQPGAALQADFFIEALPGMHRSDDMMKRGSDRLNCAYQRWNAPTRGAFHPQRLQERQPITQRRPRPPAPPRAACHRPRPRPTPAPPRIDAHHA